MYFVYFLKMTQISSFDTKFTQIGRTFYGRFKRPLALLIELSCSSEFTLKQVYIILNFAYLTLNGLYSVRGKGQWD